MIYFDNGATSFPKPRGMSAEMEDCIQNYCGNPGRSGHYMSMKTGEKVYEARKSIAKVFNIKDPGRLTFTKNTTEALNAGLLGFLKEGDHVVTTSMEHNSVLRPLKQLEDAGISHTIVKGDEEGFVSADAIRAAITETTRLIVVTGASNVTGTIMPVEKIGRLAAQCNIPFMLDAAQCGGCMPIDVEKCNISMLAFPGHKGLLGPLGTGALYVAPDIEIKPLICGGTGTESRSRVQPCDFPEGYESGTINAPGIIGLGYSARFIEKVGIQTIEFYERELIKRFDDRIRNMNFIDMYGPVPAGKTGISLFNIRNVECEEVTALLNRDYGIAVRGGYHCAGLAHKTIGTWETGAVRLSVGPFNTRREIDRAVDAVWKIGKKMQ
ncbi:Probable cysteine desulfurase [uncultured Eubacterium sp.]|nr:Probable cysteine desulfurase [uncultured Eubacterium sp.]